MRKVKYSQLWPVALCAISRTLAAALAAIALPPVGYRLIAGPTPNFLTRDETVHKNQVASSFSEPEADPGHMAIGSASPGTRVAMAC